MTVLGSPFPRLELPKPTDICFEEGLHTLRFSVCEGLPRPHRKQVRVIVLLSFMVTVEEKSK